MAGPIVRASEFLPQLRERPDPQRIAATEAFFLIAAGLFKKVVIAELPGAPRSSTPSSPTPASSPALRDPGRRLRLRHADLRRLQRLHRHRHRHRRCCSAIRFPQNFDRPYSALSLQDFWRRWHITLSRWLRDYLYIPLGGSRGSGASVYRNLMLTMVLGGLWHGAAWTFVVWGGLHGMYQCVGHWRTGRRADQEADGTLRPSVIPPNLRPVLAWLATFNLVCFAWIFFRAESFSAAFELIAGLFNITDLLPGADHAGDPDHRRDAGGPVHAPLDRRVEPGGLLPTHPGAAGRRLAVAFVGIDTLGPVGVAPFIYFQF